MSRYRVIKRGDAFIPQKLSFGRWWTLWDKWGEGYLVAFSTQTLAEEHIAWAIRQSAPEKVISEIEG